MILQISLNFYLTSYHLLKIPKAPFKKKEISKILIKFCDNYIFSRSNFKEEREIIFAAFLFTLLHRFRSYFPCTHSVSESVLSVSGAGWVEFTMIRFNRAK